MRKYKQFFIKTLIIFLISMIIIPTGLICWIDYMVGRHHYSKTADYVNYLIEQKTKVAKDFDKQGKKIVIFSGSNSLYGVNSKYIHETTGLPVVNFGIHMGLEHYIFHEAEKILKPGDIVIMPLEFSIYKKDSSTVPSQLAEYIVTYGKDYVKQLTPIQKLGLSFYLIKLIITYHGLDCDKLDDKTLGQTNDFGDFTANEGIVPDIQNNRKFIKIEEAIPKNNKNFSLYDFIQYCKNNNIKLYATNPFHYHRQEYSGQEQEAFNNIKNFYEKNGVEFIGDINTGAVYDEKLIYDFGYHANDAGQKIRSDYLAKIISSMCID